MGAAAQCCAGGDRCVAEEKVRHCDHLLGLAAVLSPGQSELRGNLLYHKSGALRHLLESGPSTKAEVTHGVASCRYSRCVLKYRVQPHWTDASYIIIG